MQTLPPRVSVTGLEGKGAVELLNAETITNYLYDRDAGATRLAT
jgi:hypothetical protein